MKRPYETDTLSTIKEFAPTIIKIAIVPLLIIIGLVAWNIFGSNDTFAYVRDFNEVTGSREARVKVLYYEDFQCSACRSNHSNKQAFAAQLPQDTALIQRHLPLQSLHPLAPAASRAVQAAGYQGKYSEMSDKIYANQDSLSGDNLKLWASEIGLDYAQWEQDWNGNKVREEVDMDMNDLKNMEFPANDQGVAKKKGDSGSGTPTTVILVDDKPVWWMVGTWTSPSMIYSKITELSGIASPIAEPTNQTVESQIDPSTIENLVPTNEATTELIEPVETPSNG